MRSLRRALLLLAVIGACMCAADDDAIVTVSVTVPKPVAAQAGARLAGDTHAPTPILMLQDLEVGAGEGLTVHVLGPREPGSGKPGTLLAVASLVGSRQRSLAEPRKRMTMAVPLNDEGTRLVKGHSEVVLTLQVLGSPGRPALKFTRAYFDEGAE